MENETQGEELAQAESKSLLHSVTPLSKYLAMALFIVMPFIGGWVGYTYAPEKVVEVERVVVKEVVVVESEEKPEIEIENEVTQEENPVTSSDINAYVTVVDAEGQPIQPDRVFWYYPPVAGAATVETPAKCENEVCTRWEISGAIGDTIYAAASYERGHTDPYCGFSAYDASIISLSSVDIEEITLTLEESEWCE